MFEYYKSLIQKCDTSYKLFLLKFLFEEVSNGKKEFSFYELGCGIISTAWDYINDRACRFSFHDRLYDLFIDLIRKQEVIDNYSSKEDVYKYLIKIDNAAIKRKINNLVNYVPYRLIVDNEISFLLKGQIDRKKNKIIEKISNEDINTMYSINNRSIYVRNKYSDDIKRNRILLVDWINKEIKNKVGVHL